MGLPLPSSTAHLDTLTMHYCILANDCKPRHEHKSLNIILTVILTKFKDCPSCDRDHEPEGRFKAMSSTV